MTLNVYPTLATLGYSVGRQIRQAARTQKAVSGRQFRVLDQPLPIRTWTLTYEVLRDKWDTSGGVGQGTGFDELRTIEGFILQQQGSFQPFLFSDPADNSITGQAIGTGDGTTTAFQLVRSMGGFSEPITAPNVVSHVYNNGVDAGGWTASTSGLITYGSAPAAGRAITADFTYYFTVHFTDDSADFDNFMYQLFALKQIKFESLL